jgi:hypothetical protein
MMLPPEYSADLRISITDNIYYCRLERWTWSTDRKDSSKSAENGFRD